MRYDDELITMSVFFTPRSLLHPELSNMDTINVVSSPPSDDVIKRIIEDYLKRMILPTSACCTRIVEGDEKVLIFDRKQYVLLYKKGNRRVFIEKFIETSMFSVYLVKKNL